MLKAMHDKKIAVLDKNEFIEAVIIALAEKIII